MLVVIVFGILIPIIKPTIKKESIVYLYAFSTGYFIVLALFGLLREALENIEEGVQLLAKNSKSLATFIVILILVLGVGIGMGGGLILRYIMTKNHPELHNDHSAHGHPDTIFSASEITNKKSK
jgi:hypothetical protein